MLAIRRRHKPLTAFSVGSLAFAIGLTGAAAYVGSTLVHENLTFNKQQTASKNETNTTSGVAGAQTSAPLAQPGSGTNVGEVQPQAMSSWSTMPSSSGTGSNMMVAPAPTPVASPAAPLPSDPLPPTPVEPDPTPLPPPPNTDGILPDTTIPLPDTELLDGIDM